MLMKTESRQIKEKRGNLMLKNYSNPTARKVRKRKEIKF